MDPIYRPRDAATYLGVGLTMLYELSRGGQLPRPVKIKEGGRASGWRKSTLDQFIESRQAATEQAGE